MISKEAAYTIIEDLVTRFEEQLASYKKADYNETQTRRDFIDPFFKALGWDMDNSQGNAEAYREVIHEDKVKVGAATKAPDYSFKLPGGKRLFFVEAKKPSVAVKDEIMPAYQIRRYAWSAKLPISILTDFEEFAIYDCNKKPNATDKPSVGRIKYLTFREYLKEFDFLWNTFSKGSVLRGSFDKFIAADKNKKGTTTVDKEFLTSLDEWRKQLALNIALRNEAHTEEELNFVVQQTLDRLIFLRIAEDRGVEEYGRLQSFVSSPKGGSQEGTCYQNLFTYFKEADSKYNSGLFDFKKDSISHKTLIDNKTIKGIINELYYPISPYEFSVLSVEILGSAYEQFLGKQIKLTPGHRAIIEEKPEVRKAGGVYYTPQYIVEYIVENTVGKLAPMPPSPKGEKQTTPAEVAKLKIVDPACGSGSFLLGAYQYLLNWHVEFYMPEFEKLTAIAQNSAAYTEKERNEAIKERNKLPLTPTGHLTTALKKQILLNNIYGVDIDTQAVEVTKLSLLLKCMEGETGSSINAEMRFGERVLPTLDSNIKSGNSLIDMDFYDGQIDFEPALEKKVKPFSWEQGFAAVFKQGGFDAVIGNPPYGALFNEEEISYYKTNYKTSVWRGESYLLFIEKALKLLKLEGLQGYIIPDTLLNLGFTQPTREHLLSNSKLIEIVSLPSNIFSGATVDTILLFTEKKESVSNFHDALVNILVFNKKTTISIIANPSRAFKVKTQEWFFNNSYNLQTDSSEKKLIEKIENQNKSIADFAEIYSGIKAYEVGKGRPFQTEKIRDTKPYTSPNKEDKEWEPFYDGKNIGRYQLSWNNNNWIKYGEWLAAPRNPENFVGEKILIRKIIGKTLIANYIPATSYCNTLLFVLKLKDDKYSYKAVLGILNSLLIGWYFKKKFQISDEDTFPQIMVRDILKFPLPIIEKIQNDEIVKLVETMLKLQQQKQHSHLPNELQQLEQRIAYTDAAINKKVYALYGLTEAEIKVVEGT